MLQNAQNPGSSLTLSVRSLATHFDIGHAVVRAVDGVDFDVKRGEILGLVGESGSGKTMAGLSILGLVEHPGRIVSGRIVFNGMDLARMSEVELRQVRGNKISMVFQDPLTTLSPTMRIGKQMRNVIAAHHKITAKEARDKCRDALARLGIPSADERLDAYPHELSGGMRQRVCIAMAMLNEPDLIVADEPTTALDVTTQAQILQEIRQLQERSGTAFIWVTHDLAVVSELADRLVVMYSGQILEQGETSSVLEAPGHPYTRGLLQSIPAYNRKSGRLPQIPGFAPMPGDRIDGCKFASRCANRQAVCEQPPVFADIGGNRNVRCFFPLNTTSKTGQGME